MSTPLYDLVINNLTANNYPPTDASTLTTGIVNTAVLGTGTANSSTVLYGDSTWRVVTAGSNVDSAIFLSGNTVQTNSTVLIVGSNVAINTSAVFVGNSTVNTVVTAGLISLSGITINSTAYGGTANNATFAYGKTEGNLNVNSAATALVANNSTFAYGKTEGNLNVNNATTAYGKLEAALNVNSAATALVANNSTFAYGKTEGNLNVNSAATALVANNSTFAYGKTEGALNVNSASSALVANNSTYFGGQLPAYYTNASNITGGTIPANILQGQYPIDIAGTAALAVLATTAENARYFADQSPDYYTNASNLATGTVPAARLSGTYAIDISGTANNATFAYGKTEGNLNVNNATTAYGKTEGNLNVNSAAFLSTNTVTTNTTVLAIGANVIANTSALFVGNTTVNAVITGGSILINGGAVIHVNSTTGINASALSTGTVPIARLPEVNSTASGVVNTGAQTIAGVKTFSSTIVADISGTANNTTNFGGQLPAYYTNASNISSGVLPVDRLVGQYVIDIAGTASQAVYAKTAENARFLADQSADYYTNASNLATGTVPTARLGSGTANSTTYLAGDSSWKALTQQEVQILDDISSSFNGATTTFPLTVGGLTVGPTPAQTLVSISGVIQNPTTAFSISSNNIVFTAAPVAGQPFFGIIMGVQGSSGFTNGQDISVRNLTITGNTNQTNASSNVNFTGVVYTTGNVVIGNASATLSIAGLTTLTGNLALTNASAIMNVAGVLGSTGNVAFTNAAANFTVAGNSTFSNVVTTSNTVTLNGAVAYANGQLRCDTTNGRFVLPVGADKWAT